MEKPLESVGIVGLGLIGGSLGLALRAQGIGRVVGWDRPEALAAAVAHGAISAPAGSLAQACQAQVVVLSTPIGAILDLLPETLQSAPGSTLVTDTGSTKMAICRRAAGLPGAEKFVGGHPLAGGERTGIECSRAELFSGAAWLLAGETPNPRARLWEETLERLGARPAWMSAARHDQLMARVSHLPQLLSTALAALLERYGEEQPEAIQLSGPGLRDMLRLAGSSYSLWRDILLTNEAEIAAALHEMELLLDHLRANLRTRELADVFASALEVYRRRAPAPAPAALGEPQ